MVGISKILFIFPTFLPDALKLFRGVLIVERCIRRWEKSHT